MTMTSFTYIGTGDTTDPVQYLEHVPMRDLSDAEVAALETSADLAAYLGADPLVALRANPQLYTENH